MPEICLFAGTHEGRKLAEFLSAQDAKLTVCVATDYGGELLPVSENINISQKRLSEQEIEQLLSGHRFDLVIDATHPYAVVATRNIFSACSKTNTEYMRIIREKTHDIQNAVIVPDVPSAVDYLNQTSGNILLTTGSKDLSLLSQLKDFPERVYTRVLPMQASLSACAETGVKPSHIFAMQGPFTEEMNLAMLHAADARWLLTKDSGETGGFEAKISAAEKAGVGLVVIGRPQQQDGLSESAAISALCSRFGFTRKPVVSIVGIGPGNTGSMTIDACHAIDKAECLIGAQRMLDSVQSPMNVRFAAVDPDRIAELIECHPEYQKFAVLMSGDTSFYSGTRRLLPKLQNCEIQVLPGISSLVYLCSKLRISCENIPTVSLHGRDHDIIRDVRSHHRIFLLTGGTNTVSTVCRTLIEDGLSCLQITVGERLSYPDEKITFGTPSELASGSFDPLSVLLIENGHPDRIVTHGLPDEIFLRGSGEKGVVPMTKSEVRSICLSKLALTENAVCWDIGSGTGSVAIEMAMQAPKGSVFGIEKDSAAAALSRENAERLHISNIDIIEGTAPEACDSLPTPAHVFIGGSSGSLREIFTRLFERHHSMRIVVTAVTLDTIAEMNRILDELPFSQSEVVMIQTARDKKIGSHRLMCGGNPVYIFSLTIPGDQE